MVYNLCEIPTHPTRAPFIFFLSNIRIHLLQVNLPKGFAYVEFKTRIDAEKAQLHMDGVWF